MPRKDAIASSLDPSSLLDEEASEDRCRAYLEELRWPDGVVCPRCGSQRPSRIKARHQFGCSSCDYQFSVRTGTVLHNSNLPLRKWFLAVCLMAECPTGVSTRHLSRTLGTSYKTAWSLGHRIRLAMVDSAPAEVRELIHYDETYVPPRHGRGLVGSTPAPASLVVGAVQHDRRLKLEATDVDSPLPLDAFLRPRPRDELDSGLVEIRDDALAEPSGVTSEQTWSAFARALKTTHRHVSVKYIGTYLDEAAFRYANRSNRDRFRATLLRLIASDSRRHADGDAG